MTPEYLHLPERISHLLRSNGGVINIANHPAEGYAVTRAARAGQLTRLMRGLYVAAGTEHDPHILVWAVQTANPHIIFTGLTAAWILGFNVRVTTITGLNAPRTHHFGPVELGVGQLPDSVWGEYRSLRCLSPAMAAIDVVPSYGPGLIDDLLRASTDPESTMRQLRTALAETPGRRGNAIRRRALARSRTHPWSVAERAMHDLLDRAGITGWSANQRIQLNGERYYPDIVFRVAGLVVEIDGYKFHTSPEAFQVDRERQNALQEGSWRILRYTWHDIKSRPEETVAQIRRMLA